MQNTYQCPKCGSGEVIKIPGNRYNTELRISLSRWSTRHAKLNRYICTECGFTEEWVVLDNKFHKWVKRNEKTIFPDGGFV